MHDFPEERNRQGFEEHEQSLSVVEQFGNHMPGGFFICRVNENGDLLYANDTVFNIFGCKTYGEFRELTGFTLRGMIYPEDYGEVFSIVKRQTGSKEKASGYMEYRIVRKDGEVRWVDEYSYYVKSDSSEGIYYVFISDITEKRMKAENDKAMRSAVIEALTRMYDSVWLITDMEKQTFELYRIDNEMAHMMPANEAIKITRFQDALRFYSRLVVEEDRQRFLEATSPENIVKNTENKLLYSVPFRRIFEDGIRYYRVEFARLDLKNEKASIVGGFKNVDEEVRRDQNIQKALREAIVLSETDLMTGVCNRMTGESRVSSLLENGRRGMFVLFDIDNFKAFNDRFGHNVGDQVIRAVADSLKNTFRGGDVVMRLGGDEFAAFASGVEDRENAEKLMMRFYDNLSNAVIREGMEKIKVSAGAAFTHGDIADDFLRLYESADKGMYESKRAHDGRITFCE